MSHKSPKIAELIEHLQGGAHDAHYLGFFECFNRQLFYEAHDVLEELWLECRKTEKDEFYKALIQLAGAFVHLQKERLYPSGKLFQLSRSYFVKYPEAYESISVSNILKLIDEWYDLLKSTDFTENPLKSANPPHLALPA